MPESGDRHGFEAKVRSRTAVVGVVGLGHGGLPVGLALCEAGLNVLGFEVDAAEIHALACGESSVERVGPERVAAAVTNGLFRATADLDRLSVCDAILLFVPDTRRSQRDAHAETLRDIAKRLRRGQLVVVESASCSRSWEEEVRSSLERSGLRCGHDFMLAFRVRPEPTDRDEPSPSASLVPANDLEAGRCAAMLYAADEPPPVSAARVVALVNQLNVICERIDVDVTKTTIEPRPDAEASRFVSGSPAIRSDVLHLAWTAARRGDWARFVELATEIDALSTEGRLEADPNAVPMASSDPWRPRSRKASAAFRGRADRRRSG